MNIPIPGMRVIKTAIAVFLCLVIVDMTGDQYSGYSAIVAIICMQKDWDNSINTSVNRVIGTVFGVAFGLVTFQLNFTLGFHSRGVIPYFVISVMMVFLMYTIILIEKKDVTAVACIIFLSVAAFNDPEMGVMYFAFRRMIDTFVGIGISLLVNITITEPGIKKVKAAGKKTLKILFGQSD